MRDQLREAKCSRRQHYAIVSMKDKLFEQQIRVVAKTSYVLLISMMRDSTALIALVVQLSQTLLSVIPSCTFFGYMLLKACSRSAINSSAFSRPIDSRTRSQGS